MLNRYVSSALMAVAASVIPASAGIIVTPAGAALGFTATTVISGLPISGSFGPFGLTLSSDGHLFVSDEANGLRYVFNDVDGQTLANALSSTPSGSGVQAYANVGGKAYGGNGSNFAQFNNDGTVNHTIVPTLFPSLGIAGNSVSGKLIATSNQGLVEIDPTANTFRVISAGASGDGVSVSPDGNVAYLATGSTITGYNIATGAVVFTSGSIAGGPDGTGVISSSNALNGFIVVNSNDGNVSLIDPVTKALTIIATNSGQRGDYVSPDISNGTLLLDFSSEIGRLSCGAGCSIGAPPPTSAPEAASLPLTGLGLVGLGLSAVIRRKYQASQS